MKLRPDQQPLPIGRGSAYRLPALSAAVRSKSPVGGLTCTPLRAAGAMFAAHLELFARRHVLPVPAGIGIAPPQQRRGAYVLSGACGYPVRTHEPTGVLVLSAGERRLTLDDFFAVWGQRLTAGSLAGFQGPVSAFVDGHPWRGDPRSIRLRRHAEIVVEVGGLVVPHPTYRFPPGL